MNTGRARSADALPRHGAGDQTLHKRNACQRHRSAFREQSRQHDAACSGPVIEAIDAPDLALAVEHVIVFVLP
jgi:hypothetical protein